MTIFLESIDVLLTFIETFVTGVKVTRGDHILFFLLFRRRWNQNELFAWKLSFFRKMALPGFCGIFYHCPLVQQSMMPCTTYAIGPLARTLSNSSRNSQYKIVLVVFLQRFCWIFDSERSFAVLWSITTRNFSSYSHVGYSMVSMRIYSSSNSASNLRVNKWIKIGLASFTLQSKLRNKADVCLNLVWSAWTACTA